MQIKHLNPFHLAGVGIKHCKKAKQTKGFSKAVFLLLQAKPYKLLNLLKLVFFVGILKTFGKCLTSTKRQKDKGATAILPFLLSCVEYIAAHPFTECTSKAVKINQMSPVLINMNNVHNMIMQYLTMQNHTYKCAHMMKCCAEMQH